MGRPPGSRNKPKAPVTVELKSDGYANVFSSTGTRADRSTFTRISSPAYIDQVTASFLYLGGGIGRRLIDMPVEEMTRAGVEFDGMDEALEQSLYAEFDDLDVMKHVADALRWADVFGGSMIVMGLNDGNQLDMPLNEDGIKSVEFLRVYDRWQTSVGRRYTDPMNPGYGKPELYLISPHTGGAPYQVHESRVLIFDGDPVPDLQRQQQDGWGASKYQACNDALTRFGTSHQWANSLLERAQQAVHGIPELANILRTAGGESQVQKRVDVVDMVRGILNTIVIDSQETYDLKATSFSQIPDILDRFAEALSAITGIPMYLLIGRSPGGLNATGASNEEAWYARVGAMQNDRLRKPLNRLVQLILLSLSGDTGGDWKLCFKPLKVPSDKEKAEIEKLEADACKAKADEAVAYVGIGALDQSEVRLLIAEKYEISDPIPLPEPEPDDSDVIAGNTNGNV